MKARLKMRMKVRMKISFNGSMKVESGDEYVGDVEGYVLDLPS